MTRSTWTGRSVTKAVAYVVDRDNGICHLCDHHGANSCDHVLPVATHPELEWVPSNWKAAHLAGAGATGGCPVPGCHCPGNRARGNAPADVVRATVARLNATTTDTHSREW